MLWGYEEKKAGYLQMWSQLYMNSGLCNQSLSRCINYLLRSVLVTVMTTPSTEFSVLHFRPKAANIRRQVCSHLEGWSLSRTVGQVCHRLITNP